MVPIIHLNTSQAEAPLIQHLNQTETPPNHGDLSQAEAPSDTTERLHNTNLNQSSSVGRSGSKQWKEIISHLMQQMQKKLKYTNVSCFKDFTL